MWFAPVFDEFSVADFLLDDNEASDIGSLKLNEQQEAIQVPNLPSSSSSMSENKIDTQTLVPKDSDNESAASSFYVTKGMGYKWKIKMFVGSRNSIMFTKDRVSENNSEQIISFTRADCTAFQNHIKENAILKECVVMCFPHNDAKYNGLKVFLPSVPIEQPTIIAMVVDELKNWYKKKECEIHADLAAMTKTLLDKSSETKGKKPALKKINLMPSIQGAISSSGSTSSSSIRVMRQENQEEKTVDQPVLAENSTSRPCFYYYKAKILKPESAKWKLEVFYQDNMVNIVKYKIDKNGEDKKGFNRQEENEMRDYFAEDNLLKNITRYTGVEKAILHVKLSPDDQINKDKIIIDIMEKLQDYYCVNKFRIINKLEIDNLKLTKTTIPQTATSDYASPFLYRGHPLFNPAPAFLVTAPTPYPTSQGMVEPTISSCISQVPVSTVQIDPVQIIGEPTQVYKKQKI